MGGIAGYYFQKVSAGKARSDAEDKTKLVEIADKMLYEAKRLGKNRVCLSGDKI